MNKISKIIEHPILELLRNCNYITEQDDCLGYDEGECENCEIRSYLENILKINLDEKQN